jgi:hypothetical protein
VAFSAGAPGAEGVGSAGCDVIEIAPIPISGLGVVCVSPDTGCPEGRRDCDGGTRLGQNVISDANTGMCTSNTQCEATCNGLSAGRQLLQFGCTGFCSAGAQQACTRDVDCLPNDGACNGPDPVFPAGICQCTWLDASFEEFGASDAGDFQCNLGTSLVVHEFQTPASCSAPIRINVGQTCIPLNTQRVSARVLNAGGVAGRTVPAGVLQNVADGTGISCEAFDAGNLTDMKAVGAINFFGSALGDLSVRLTAVCE